MCLFLQVSSILRTILMILQVSIFPEMKIAPLIAHFVVKTLVICIMRNLIWRVFIFHLLMDMCVTFVISLVNLDMLLTVTIQYIIIKIRNKYKKIVLCMFRVQRPMRRIYLNILGKYFSTLEYHFVFPTFKCAFPFINN